MTDVAMEIWGKAAGGREAAAHLVIVFVLSVSVCAMFCTCQFFGLIRYSGPHPKQGYRMILVPT